MSLGNLFDSDAARSAKHEQTIQELLLARKLIVSGQVGTINGGAALAVHTHADTTQGGDLWTKGADIASTTALPVDVVGHYFHVTGTTMITSLAARPAGAEIILEFDSALQLQNSANLLLAGAANMTTVPGDVIRFTSEGGGVWRQSSAKQTASRTPYEIYISFGSSIDGISVAP